jgi:3-methylcrotonyl-CoA carboxylase alpha subunit
VNGLRIETGYDWDPVPSFYDPMIAKLIFHRRDRESAIDSLARELSQAIIGPIVTNAQFLLRALRHPAFRAGEIDTGFVERHLADLTTTAPLSQPARDYAADYFVGLRFEGDHEFEKSDVWSSRRGFRLNAPAAATVRLTVDGEPGEGRYDNYFGPHAPLLGLGDYFDGDTAWLNEDGRTHLVRLSEVRGVAGGIAGDGAILAPMPGRVTAVEVATGDTVTKGQRLVTLEAMKMEHGMTAPFDGVVAELNAVAGAQVSEGTLLVKIDKLA